MPTSAGSFPSSLHISYYLAALTSPVKSSCEAGSAPQKLGVSRTSYCIQIQIQENEKMKMNEKEKERKKKKELKGLNGVL